MAVLAVSLAAVLGTLAGLHLYWAAGGAIGKGVAIPSRGGERLFRPSRVATLAVAAGLVVAALCGIWLSPGSIAPMSPFLPRVGGIVLAVVFGLRAVGDHRYVGFFKRVRGTSFARWDTRLYSPLCLAISVGFTVLVWNSLKTR